MRLAVTFALALPLSGVCLGCGVDDALSIVSLDDVGSDGDGCSAARVDLVGSRLASVTTSARDEDGRTRRRQSATEGSADTASPTGHNGNPVLEGQPHVGRIAHLTTLL